MHLKFAQELFLTCCLFLVLPNDSNFAQSRVLDATMHHLRVGGHPEWLGFPGSPKAEMRVDFDCSANPGEMIIRLGQEDIKRNWQVLLNGEPIGKLVADESPMLAYFSVPPMLLRSGNNTLAVMTSDTIPDDIMVGKVVLITGPVQQLVTESRVQVTITDGATGLPLPGRLTIVNHDRMLQPVAATPAPNMAHRPGSVYLGDGAGSFTLPAGSYTVYANHGFEYGVDSSRLVVKKGATVNMKLIISKEVLVTGWISSDTHIHTLTYSGHGDATAAERVLTIAGEGIEMPVTTDHNIKVDLDSLSLAMGMRKYFTPVTGYEFTTALGHFNVFPQSPGSGVPDVHINSWDGLSKVLAPKKDEIIILNHARDVHSGFAPFDPADHISVTGKDLRGWEFPANAMEVLNSSSQQADFMNLFNDWFGMLNRGYRLTPVGASDSHTLSQYLLGQGRTYIKLGNADRAAINVPEALTNFRDGKVMVSFGLLTEMRVNDQYGPGEMVPGTGKGLTVSVRVMGPGWTRASKVSLYANGVKIREEIIRGGGKPGLKFSKTWQLPAPAQDLFIVCIAEGPEPVNAFWRVPKPYDPTSPKWTPRVIGASGAIWIDGDKDGNRTSAYSYARKLVAEANGSFSDLVKSMAGYDESVAAQVAGILQEQGRRLNSRELTKALKHGNRATQAGFEKFRKQYRQTAISRAGDKD
jgi:hypothetical protein